MRAKATSAGMAPRADMSMYVLLDTGGHRAAVRLLDATAKRVSKRHRTKAERSVYRAFMRTCFVEGCGLRYFSTQSAHFATESPPHGMIGTDEVEFFGEPSMMRSLNTM